jgi:hypothetical protein
MSREPRFRFCHYRSIITLSLSVLGVLAVAAPASAQMQRSTLESLAVSPPAHPLNASVNLTQLYQDDYRVFQNYATNAANENTEDPANVAYAQYTAPQGATVLLFPGFGETVPEPDLTHDACHHAHLEWAIYLTGYRTIRFGFSYFRVPAVRLKRSSGEIGRRVDWNGNVVPDLTPNVRCIVSSVPDGLFGTSAFTWGVDNDFVTFTTSGDFTTTGTVFAMQGVQHGWGSCGRFVCFPQVTLEAYRYQ